MFFHRKCENLPFPLRKWLILLNFAASKGCQVKPFKDQILLCSQVQKDKSSYWPSEVNVLNYSFIHVCWSDAVLFFTVGLLPLMLHFSIRVPHAAFCSWYPMFFLSLSPVCGSWLHPWALITAAHAATRSLLCNWWLSDAQAAEEDGGWGVLSSPKLKRCRRDFPTLVSSCFVVPWRRAFCDSVLQTKKEVCLSKDELPERINNSFHLQNAPSATGASCRLLQNASQRFLFVLLKNFRRKHHTSEASRKCFCECYNASVMLIQSKRKVNGDWCKWNLMVSHCLVLF